MIFDDGTKLPKADALRLHDYTESTVQKASKALESLSRGIKKATALSEIDREVLRNMPGVDSDYCNSKAESIAEELYDCIRKNTMYLYQVAQIPPENIGCPDLDIGMYATQSIENRVNVKLHKEAIYVRLPMLWARNQRYGRGQYGQITGREKIIFFRDDIAACIKRADEFETFDFEKFSSKIVHYLYVYSDHPAQKRFVVDNDNHETKYVQDAITMFLPYGDSPFWCSTYSSAILSNRIPEGTYITVTPYQTGILTDERVVAWWEKHLSRRMNPPYRHDDNT